MNPEKIPRVPEILSIIILLTCFPSAAKAQENINEEIITAIAEEISSTEENGAGLESITDKIYELEINPVRVNMGNMKENGRLFFLSAYQIKALTDYVRQHGRIISLQEISAINGFDRETAAMIAPFITFGESPHGQTVHSRRLSQTLLNNFAVKPGYGERNSQGSQWKILTKYRMSAGSISAGLTAEKDAGEKYFSGNPPAPDFFSGYLGYNGKGILREVIAGDYSASFGMGAVINTGFRSGLSPALPGLLTPAGEIRPHTSAEENNFFRGIAFTLGKGRFESTLFSSLNSIDATLNNCNDSLNKTVKSLYTSGLHNTATSLLKKDLLREFTWGVTTSAYFRSFSIGVIFTQNVFSLTFSPDRSDPEDFHDFSGRSNSLAGLWYSAAAGRFIFSGEAATNPGLKPAITQSVSFVPGDRISFSFLYRFYSPEFISFHGKGMFSGSSPTNEEAMLGALKYEAARYLFISAGSEVRKHPWARYLTSFPSSSVQSEVSINYLPQRLNIEAVYRFRSSLYNLNIITGVPGIKEVITHSVSIRAKYMSSGSLSVAARSDLKTCSSGVAPGMMLGGELTWQPGVMPVRLWLRHSLFSTGGWDTRIYAFENDLLNSFSIPALSGKGSRTYVMVEWKPAKKVMMRIKYGVTSKIINTGKWEFSDELKLQMKVSL